MGFVKSLAEIIDHTYRVVANPPKKQIDGLISVYDTNTLGMSPQEKLKHLEQEFKMKSFVENFAGIFFSMMYHRTGEIARESIGLKDENGDSFTIGPTSFQRLTPEIANPMDGIDYAGIIVGSDDGTILPLDINNHKLGAHITHGSGAGQLNYGAVSGAEPFDQGTEVRWQFRRNFGNDSGANVTIKEIGLATDKAADNYILWERSLPSSFTIAPTFSKDIEYTFII